MYLYNLWTRFEGVDNLTACDSVMLKGSFSHGRAYLSLNCCKKNKKAKKKKKKKNLNVRYSKEFISAFYFLETFPVVLAILTSQSMIKLFGFFGALTRFFFISSFEF